MAAVGLGLGLELRLGLPGASSIDEPINEKKKRVFSQMEFEGKKNATKKSSNNNVVVGWPPVCSYRRKNSFNAGGDDQDSGNTKILYVKVSMDGAPFLRKINLSAQKDYSDLETNLQKLFSSSLELVNEAFSLEYVPIYEDRDGDWMLLGDVPWTMFIESCKKLRIMKRAEAIGIGLGIATNGSSQFSS
uniref:Auxin-responsive protein n=1 Tax=Galium aparine TaxID=29788 RepID=A0A896W763_GALAP|nr:IAA22 [Galium aparine]